MNFLDILRTLTGSGNYFAQPDQVRAAAGPGGVPVLPTGGPIGTPQDAYRSGYGNSLPSGPDALTRILFGEAADPNFSFKKALQIDAGINGLKHTFGGGPAQPQPHPGQDMQGVPHRGISGQNMLAMGTPQDAYQGGYGSSQPAQPMPHPGQTMGATPLAQPGQDTSATPLAHPGQVMNDPWLGLRHVSPGAQTAQNDPWGGTRAQQQDPMTIGATAPAQPQQASPSLWDRYQNFTHSGRGQALNDMFAGWAMGKTPQQSLGYGAKLMTSNRDKRQQVNDTVKWLTGRGMSESEAKTLARNPTLLTATIKQMQGQKPTSDIQNYQFAVQNGYKGNFADWQKNGKSDSYGQSPIILTDPNGKMHMGQMSSGGGMLVDGKTYSSLPANWKVGTVSQSGSGGLSPETLDILATQYLAGDKSAIQGFSRNANMRAQLANAIAKKADAMGMDGKSVAAEISAYGGNVAAQRSAGTRAAQVGMAASEANKMADVALEASKAVPRASLRAWNHLQNAVRTGTSSPEMAAFVTATTSLVNAYARAVSPLGSPTDAMRQHAEQMLNTAQSPQAYEAVINQMKKEMEAALHAPAEISNQLKEQVTGRPESPATPAQAPSSPNAAPTATNPQTGQKVQWNGSQWVPMQ